MADNYEDIINMVHPTSKKHPKMSMYARAAQFSPFAALTGHDDAVKEAARQTERFIELDEDSLARLNDKLNMIEENIDADIPVSITYFVPDERKAGGSYQTISGIVKRIDEYESAMLMRDGLKIPICRIYEIESEMFKGFVVE